MRLFQSLLMGFMVSTLVACAVSKSSDGSGLTPTIYFKPTIRVSEKVCSADKQRELLSVEGYTLETVCESDYRQCLLQGSCFVMRADGVVTSYNYHSTREGVARFVVVDMKRCPFGYGVKNSCLDPYFSAAADMEYYKAGDVIFIPRLVGASLPSGEIHDGFVVIRDVGQAIKGVARFDFFTGFYDHRARENTFARLGFGDPKNRIEFRMATEEEAELARQRRGYPGLKQSVLEQEFPF